MHFDLFEGFLVGVHPAVQNPLKDEGEAAPVEAADVVVVVVLGDSSFDWSRRFPHRHWMPGSSRDQTPVSLPEGYLLNCLVVVDVVASHLLRFGSALEVAVVAEHVHVAPERHMAAETFPVVVGFAFV